MGEAESGVTYANKDNNIKETFIIDFLQKDTSSNMRACYRGDKKQHMDTYGNMKEM